MAKPIRVMMLIKYYFRESTGGAERQIASLAPLLQERNVELCVVSRCGPGVPTYEEIQGVPVFRSPYIKNGSLSSVFYTLFGVARINRMRPDVLHAHGLFSPTSTAVIASRLFNIPVVAKALRGGTLGDVIRIKEKFMGDRRIANLGKNVAGFITISEEIKGELISEGTPGEKCHYIPNGVDAERFKPLPPNQKQQQRETMGLLDGPLVVYVGRLVTAKRVDNLIKSWEAVRQKFPTAQLLIIGRGHEKERLEKIAGEGIRFIGPIDNVPAWLQIADLYVLPSVAEGLSNSLLEAMASELPIVATAVGDAPKLITPQENGWCIPPDDIEALTDAVIEALSDLDRIKLMGKRNRERILNDFQLSVTADKLRHLYDEVSTPHA